MGLPGLMRFEAEVEAGKGRQVWAAIEELASGYPKDDVAATMDQVRADAFVDLVLVNVTVTTVVDLALPAGRPRRSFAGGMVRGLWPGSGFPGRRECRRWCSSWRFDVGGPHHRRPD